MELQNEIARVAYEIFTEHGCLPGHELENWLAAEQIVQSRQISDRKLEELTVKDDPNIETIELVEDPAAC